MALNKRVVSEDSVLLKAEFPLVVTTEQSDRLFMWAGGCRAMYNFFLAEIKASYLDTKNFRFYNENAADLSKLKAFPEFSWLREIPASALQHTLQDLNKSLLKFLKDKKEQAQDPAGFPGFKKRKHGEAGFHFSQVDFYQNIKVIDSVTYFKYKGHLFKIAYKKPNKNGNNRPIPTNFKSASIKLKGGTWYISFTYEKKIEKLTNRKPITGLDLNGRIHVAEDQSYPVVKPFVENQNKLKELQRSLSRKIKDSKNYNKCLLAFQKLNKRCANAQKDFAHKLTKHLVNSYETVVIEDLDNKGIQKKFGKLIANNSFGLIRDLLEYKCQLTGTNLIIADRYFPSSQLCSCCGSRQKLKLSDRIYNCPVCGTSICRDKNSEINLRNYGLELTHVGY